MVTSELMVAQYGSCGGPMMNLVDDFRRGKMTMDRIVMLVMSKKMKMG